jgi:hypothetical protein
MKRIGYGIACVVSLLALAADDKGTVVELGDMRSRTPASWVAQRTTNQFRLAQFKLPKVDGDKRDAEVVVFQGISGSPEANIKRWKGQFAPPQGKTIDDVAKVSEMKVGSADVHVLDIHGTYLFKAQPFNPNSPVEKLPDYRMEGVIFQTKQGQYQIRLVGPEKTVDHYNSGFDEWLKSFK